MGHWVTFTWAGLQFTAEVNYTPGTSGRVTGPPEDCYPPEPSEVEFISLDCGQDTAMFLLYSDRSEWIHEAALTALEKTLEDEGPDYEPIEPNFDDDIPY